MQTEEKIIIRDALVALVNMPNDHIVWKSQLTKTVTTKGQGGICSNIDDLRLKNNEHMGDHDIVKGTMKRLFMAWPKYSGEPHYPIPGGFAAYNRCVGDWIAGSAPFTFWEGEQGKLRTELCNFMIDELNKEIDCAD